MYTVPRELEASLAEVTKAKADVEAAKAAVVGHGIGRNWGSEGLRFSVGELRVWDPMPTARIVVRVWLCGVGD